VTLVNKVERLFDIRRRLFRDLCTVIYVFLVVCENTPFYF